MRRELVVSHNIRKKTIDRTESRSLLSELAFQAAQVRRQSLAERAGHHRRTVRKHRRCGTAVDRFHQRRTGRSCATVPKYSQTAFFDQKYEQSLSFLQMMRNVQSTIRTTMDDPKSMPITIIIPNVDTNTTTTTTTTLLVNHHRSRTQVNPFPRLTSPIARRSIVGAATASTSSSSSSAATAWRVSSVGSTLPPITLHRASLRRCARLELAPHPVEMSLARHHRCASVERRRLRRVHIVGLPTAKPNLRDRHHLGEFTKRG